MQSQFDIAWRCSEEAEELGRRAQSINAEIMVLTLRAAHGGRNWQHGYAPGSPGLGG